VFVIRFTEKRCSLTSLVAGSGGVRLPGLSTRISAPLAVAALRALTMPAFVRSRPLSTYTPRLNPFNTDGTPPR
jgi:hypothetical protein